MKKAGIYAAVISVAFLQACASIFSGKTQPVSFDSEPSEVTVTINGRVMGKTPLTTQLKKEKNQVITFEKEGYKTQTRSLDTRITGWFWVNTLGLTYGLFSSTTDRLNGSMYQYAPNRYYVNLVPKNAVGVGDMPAAARIKDFVVSSYDHLANDIKSGKGEYLESLYQLLEITPEQRAGSLSELRRLLAANKDVIGFADAVAAWQPGAALVPAVPAPTVKAQPRSGALQGR